MNCVTIDITDEEVRRVLVICVREVSSGGSGEQEPVDSRWFVLGVPSIADAA